MNRITGHTWHITGEDEFRAECECAKLALDYARQREGNDGCLWFFKECYADWEAGQFAVIFESYQTEAYKDHQLALRLKAQASGYGLEVTRKAP